jgi:hypothetical protein
MFRFIRRAAAILFFLLGLVGTIILIWFVYVAALRPFIERKWVQIPSPVEPLATLRVGDAGEIFAEGRDGGVYQFSMYPKLAWINVKETETVYSGLMCRRITDNTYQSESIPNKVMAQVSVDCGFAEQAIYLDVVLLENGETWYFEKSSNSYVILGLYVLLPIGLIIDAVLYVIGLIFLILDVVITLRRKSKQAALNEKSSPRSSSI